jgi:hypothetical protein
MPYGFSGNASCTHTPPLRLRTDHSQRRRHTKRRDRRTIYSVEKILGGTVAAASLGGEIRSPGRISDR